MVDSVKTLFVSELSKRYGRVCKLERSQSLYEIGRGVARVYIRYSKIHGSNRTFYGLRQDDLRALEGYPSILCFLWEAQREPLLVPFSQYEEVFRSTTPASDGQYKAQVCLQEDSADLYIAQAGRFNVESYFGWGELDALIDAASPRKVPELSHPQMQTLLGAIGVAKGYDVWVPQNDRPKLDWSLTTRFECRDLVPYGYDLVKGILDEVDVIWIQKGSTELRALFEVEHSTPIYSGLLRFNDIHLVVPSLRLRFSIVANDVRRDLFVRQLNRPTFRTSGLSDLCTFLEYVNVFGWFNRMKAVRETGE